MAQATYDPFRPKERNHRLAAASQQLNVNTTPNGVLPMTNAPEPTEDKVSTTKEHVFVDTRYIKQLSELLGTHAAAAEKMGVASSLVSKAILEGRAKQVNELAAKCVIDDLGGHLFGAMTITEIIDHIRDDMQEAVKHGVASFRFDDAGNLRATVSMEY